MDLPSKQHSNLGDSQTDKNPCPRIAIIGAGISGLTTAWHLQKLVPDANVTLFDASDRIGGVIQTCYPDPYLIELGADNFATLLPDALQLVDEMGLREEFVAPKQEHRIAQVVRDGKVVPIPNGFSLMQPTRLSAILSTNAISLRGKLRLFGEYFVRPRDSRDDESVESFAIRRLGRECFERLVEPIVGGIFTARSETLSMQAAMPQFVAMEREYGGLIRAAIAKRKNQSNENRSARQANGARYDQFLAPKKGMSWWLGEIAIRLRCDIKLGHEIQSLMQVDSDKWSLQASGSKPGDSLATNRFDAVVLAQPSHRAAMLLRSVQPKIASLLERIPYASSAVAVIGVPRNEIRAEALCFGVVIPKIEGRDCLAISLASEKYEGRCPNDIVLARVFMGGAVRPELMEKSDDQLLAIARKEVKELLGASSLPRWQSIVRWVGAMPQYLVGHTQLVQSIRSLTRETPTLKLTGNAYDGVGIPQCIRSARLTAEQLSQHFLKTESPS